MDWTYEVRLHKNSVQEMRSTIKNLNHSHGEKEAKCMLCPKSWTARMGLQVKSIWT